MQLPGRLSATTLGDVLGALHRRRTTGVLVLTEPDAARVHRIYFAVGLVVGIETGLPVPSLGAILRGAGRLSAGESADVERRVRAGDRRPIGEILAAETSVSRADVDAAVQAQLRATLDGLFAIEDAAIAFHPSAGAPRAARRTGLLTPRDFLHGRRRARDARARALELLGLATGADRDAVRRAFRRVAGELHPDRRVAASSAERRRAAERFAAMSAAYHLLLG
jgi:hypothetical protein